MNSHPHPSTTGTAFAVLIAATIVLTAIGGCVVKGCAEGVPNFGGGESRSYQPARRVAKVGSTRDGSVVRRRNNFASGLASPQGTPGVFTVSPVFGPDASFQRFLNAVEVVESAGRADAVGDSGRAHGSFQFHASTWQHVNDLRARRGRTPVPFLMATERAVARQFAHEYFYWLQSYLTAAGLRKPTYPQIYAAWNVGPTAFRRRGFSVRNCPQTTRRACAKIERLMNHDR